MELTIQFKPAEGDLPVQPEMWKKSTFKEKEEQIENEVRNLKGYEVGNRRTVIRLGIISVKPETTLPQLKKVADYIRKSTGLDCFQITINRQDGKAYLLFDNMDHTTGNSIKINTSEMKYLHAYIIRALGLSRKQDDRTMMRYYLVNEFKGDNAIFDEAKKAVEGTIKGKKMKELILDSLQYANMVCVGLCK